MKTTLARSRSGAVLSWALLFCAAFPGAAAEKQGPAFRFDLDPGPHAVGLKIVDQYDPARVYRSALDDLGKPYAGERARPLQTLVWYPAQHGGGAALSVRDYVTLWATETSFGEPMMPPVAREWLSVMTPGVLDTHLWAVRDAKAAAGHFPVVIYAPGASDMSWENADLCEYLASFGYVVIASPSLGVSSRSMTIDLAGTNAQASDISFLIGFAKTLQNADPSAVAVVGDSWGEVAGVFAAARDNRIDALVGLDGSTRYYPRMVTLAGDIHPENIPIPFMYVMEGDYSIEDVAHFGYPELRDGPSLFDSWTDGDLIIVHMLGLAHASLSSMWQRNEDYWGECGICQPGDYDRADAITGYAWVARYTLAFLDGYLKHDPAATRFLQKMPGENGLPRHVMTVRYHAGLHSGRSLEDLRAEVGRHGFGRLADLYAGFQKSTGGAQLDEHAVTEWAHELMSDGHLSEALALLNFNTQVHPDSTNSYLELGKAYAMSGDEPSARANYEKALEKDPNNLIARWKLANMSHAPAK